MEQFVEDEQVKLDDPVAILNLVKSCDREKLDIALKNPTTLNIIAKYKQYEDKVRKGYLGKTAVFWFTFIQHARLLFMLLFSVKVNNFRLFHKCMGEMADLFAYGGQNYARYTFINAFNHCYNCKTLSFSIL